MVVTIIFFFFALLANQQGYPVSSPDGLKCNTWTHVWSVTKGTWKLPTSVQTSITDVYWFSNTAKTKGLYIYDPSPKLGGSRYWESSANEEIVRCRSSEQRYWSRGLQKQMSCDENGVGKHTCGSLNGWILWHEGATFNYDPHPCPVAGSTGRSGDLTELWICSILTPPGNQVSPNGQKCRTWTNVYTSSTLGTRNLPTDSVPVSINDVYWLSNAQNTKGLYIYDPSPTWSENPYWTTSANSKIVRCRSSQQRNWSRGLEKEMNCNEDGIGQHACGHINGWILWHDGATFNSDHHHPCPVVGSTHIGRGDLTKLWICSSLNPPMNPPGDSVSSPDGLKCNSWTHVWSDKVGTRTLPTNLQTSINDVYWFSDLANSKGLYIYDPSPKLSGIHVWESSADAGIVRCRSSEQRYWSRGLLKQMNCHNNGVGKHTCGSHNGWILWHNGATYNHHGHPCPVTGSSHSSWGDLTELWVCSSLKVDQLTERIDALEMKLSSMNEILEKISQNVGSPVMV